MNYTNREAFLLTNFAFVSKYSRLRTTVYTGKRFGVHLTTDNVLDSLRMTGASLYCVEGAQRQIYRGFAGERHPLERSGDHRTHPMYKNCGR
jgi:hypothetical protein